MTKIYKIMAVTLAIAITVSTFTCKRVKAVEAVVAIALESAAVALTFYLCEVVVPAAAEAIDNATAKYRHELETKDYYEKLEFQNEIDNMNKEELMKAVSEIQIAMGRAKLSLEQQASYTSGDLLPAAVKAYEKVMSEYEERYSYALLALNTLRAAEEAQVVSDYNALRFTEEGLLKTTSNAFSELYSSTVENTVSDYLGIEAQVMDDTGLSLRQIAMSYPNGLPKYFPSLCAKYGAYGCYKDEFFVPDGGYVANLGYGFFYHIIVTDGEKIAVASSILKTKYFFSPFLLNVVPCVDESEFFVTCYQNGNETDKIHFIGSDISAPSPDYFDDISLVHAYIFPFEKEYKIRDMQSDYFNILKSFGSYERELTPIVVDVLKTGIEKAIEAQKEALGVDDVDITVNPGAVKADDGSITYNPSMSIADEKVGEVDTPSNPSFDWNLNLPMLSHFPLYEQCKELLENLFNYNDVVDPPSFKFYWDSNKDGTSEVYDVLDLSFLQTKLTNENMQDKSWWAVEIRVIDLIRYVIAAVVYGLFIMRLIKRLPNFYGSGPWSSI